MISDKVPGIPKAELIYSTIKNEKGETFYVTAKEHDRSVHYCYKNENGKAVKLGQSNDPLTFYKKYINRK